MEESREHERVRGSTAPTPDSSSGPGAPKRTGNAVQTPPPESGPVTPVPRFDDAAPTILDVGSGFEAATLIELPHPSEAPTVIEVPPRRAASQAVSSPKAPASNWSSAFLLPTGSVLGNRYEILQLLGEGGMGAVYKARDNELDRLIALKVIRPELASNPEILQRFKQELVLARQVTDRNIIRIFDLGEADGIRFITMEYVEGSSLHHMLRERGKFPVQEGAEIIEQVLYGLKAAHREGVIHRDLKPANIMRDNQGRILVMDFGLARSIESDGMTKTGAVLGTMEYMSPEQAMGSELDPRSDLFTVGLIFFEMLTGKMPFKADTAIASLLKRVQERAAPVSSVDNAIPIAVEKIVAKCLERDLKLRYQNASEILADLEAWHGGRAAATLQFPASSRPWGQTVPWPKIGVAAAVVVLAVVGFLFRSMLSSSKAGTSPAGPVSSLAVLPFRNASGNPSTDWLGSSIAEMLTTDVGQSTKLHVISSDSMHQLFRDLKISADTNLDDPTLRRLAQFSNADQLVWGQYIQLGDRIRLDATIQDLKRQRSTQIKAEAANQNDLFAAVDRLAQGIRSNLAVSDAVVQQLNAEAFKPSTKSLEAMRDYNDGLELVRNGKNQEAVTKFEASTKEDPGFALAYAKLGETYWKLGYGDKADDVSSKAVELAQQLPAQERYRILASEALVSNDNKKAIEYYENLAKAAPGDFSIQIALAQLYKNSGSYDTARDYLGKVLDREPNNTEALVDIAEIEGERRNPQGALEYLNRALSLAVQLDNDELRSRVLYETGHTYRLLNKPEEALRNYNDSLTIRRRLGQKAGIARALAEIAEVQYSQGKPDQAIASYKEAMQLQHEIGDKTYLSHTLLNLGSLYSDRAQYDDALKYLRESLQMQRDLHDKNYEAMCLSDIGTVYFFTSRYDDALTYYEQSLQLLEKLNATGEVPAVLYNLGDTTSRMGQFEQAVAYYLRGLDMARNANNRELAAYGAHSMATIFRYQGRYGAAATSDEEALKTYRDLKERSSSMAETLNGYGETLALLGRTEDANKALEEALGLARELKDDANASRALNYQGERSLYAEDLKSAKLLFEQALQIASRNKDTEPILRVKINLAQLAITQGGGREAAQESKRLEQEADAAGLKYLSAQCIVGRAEALLNAKDYRGAQQEAERALKTAAKPGFKFLIAEARYVQSKLDLISKNASAAESQRGQVRRILEEIAQESHSGAFLKRSDVAIMLASN